MAERAQEPMKGVPLRDIGANDRERLLALEIRLSAIGFAVLEGPARLLDWGVGVRWFGKNSRSVERSISGRLNALVRLHKPTIVVARRINHYSASANTRFAAVLRAIRAECRRNSAEFKVLPARRVQRHFALRGHSAKHEIATAIAARFEELSSKLPRRKKSYQSEARAMLVFDAAATGMAYFAGLATQKDDM